METSVVLATHNENKLREMKALLPGWRLCSLKERGVHTAPEETGKTFAENARIKAAAAMEATGMAALADDSGLEVTALNGQPGIYSARYGGDGLSDKDRALLLLRSMEGIPQRTARFVCALVCLFPDGREWLAEGVCPGEIAGFYRGSHGFGYDPVFWLPALQMTMSEITPEQKNRISHRAVAAALLRRQMGQIGSGDGFA